MFRAVRLWSFWGSESGPPFDKAALKFSLVLMLIRRGHHMRGRLFDFNDVVNECLAGREDRLVRRVGGDVEDVAFAHVVRLTAIDAGSADFAGSGLFGVDESAAG